MNASTTDKKPKLLYVDDEADNLLVFKKAFNRDFEISTNVSAVAALEILETETFDIIVSDQRMPEMTGVSFFQQINEKKMKGARLLLTGYSDMQAIIDAVNKGHIYSYCTKPWSADELKLTLKMAYEHSKISQSSNQFSPDVARELREIQKHNEASLEILKNIYPTHPDLELT
jgi:response regulator RpfG family c-di-GMP phosphodiesterase